MGIEKNSSFFYLTSAVSDGIAAITVFLLSGKTMDFDSAIRILNRLLIERQPHTFNSSWIRRHVPHVYRFFQKNIRRESDGIDWDTITRALDREFQRRWLTARRNKAKPYRNKAEVNIVLRKYNGKLYTFLTPADKDNKTIRDIISIALVRISQKGNLSAKREIIKLVRFTVEEWIEHWPRISRWKGYEHLIERCIENCVRCYRYSGSFMGYLFKTLEYAGRGLRPIVVYSLDDFLYPSGRRRIDRIAQNPETGEILIYGRNTNTRRVA